MRKVAKALPEKMEIIGCPELILIVEFCPHVSCSVTRIKTLLHCLSKCGEDVVSGRDIFQIPGFNFSGVGNLPFTISSLKVDKCF